MIAFAAFLKLKSTAFSENNTSEYGRHKKAN